MFKIFGKYLALAAVLSVAFSGISEARNWHINIKDFSYQPAELTVQVGDIVEWTNQDAMVHTVTSDNNLFNSGNLPQGQSYSHTFSEVGDFPYHCTPHPWMTGEIYVRDSAVLAELQNLTLPPNFPPQGGTLEFIMGVDNISSIQQNFDLWTMITLPNGSEYGPLINGNFTVPGMVNPSREKSQVIPSSAPAGDYFYHMFVGNYPDEFWSQDFFEFHKSASLQGGGGGMTELPVDAASWDFCEEGCVDISSSEGTERGVVFSSHPNPFNPSTNIRFTLTDKAEITLRVFNSAGREVAELASGIFDSGVHEFAFNGENLSSGVYFAYLNVGGKNFSQKLMLLK